MFRVTRGKVKFNDKFYGPNEKAGDVINDLPEEEENRLAELKFGKIVEDNNKSKNTGGGESIIPDGATVPEVKKLIEETDDIETLYKMLEYEETHENRKGVVGPLEEKIVELEQKEGKNPADINVNINPDEVVSD